MLKVRNMTGLYVQTLSFEFDRLVKISKKDRNIDSCENCNKHYSKYVSVKHVVKLQEGYDNFIEANFYCLKCCKNENIFQDEIKNFKFPMKKQFITNVLWIVK